MRVCLSFEYVIWKEFRAREQPNYFLFISVVSLIFIFFFWIFRIFFIFFSSHVHWCFFYFGILKESSWIKMNRSVLLNVRWHFKWAPPRKYTFKYIRYFRSKLRKLLGCVRLSWVREYFLCRVQCFGKIHFLIVTMLYDKCYAWRAPHTHKQTHELAPKKSGFFEF